MAKALLELSLQTLCFLNTPTATKLKNVGADHARDNSLSEALLEQLLTYTKDQPLGKTAIGIIEF